MILAAFSWTCITTWSFCSFVDAESYSGRRKTKGNGQRNCCQSTVCTKGIPINVQKTCFMIL